MVQCPLWIFFKTFTREQNPACVAENIQLMSSTKIFLGGSLQQERHILSVLSYGKILLYTRAHHRIN